MSRAYPGLTPSDREAILAASIRNNDATGVTGLLACDGARFLQTLEGDDDSVDTCFNRIRQDKRHFDVVVIEDEKIDDRQFGEWSLACRSKLTMGKGEFRSMITNDVASVMDIRLKAMFIGFAALARF